MLYLVNERIYPDAAVVAGIVLIFISAFYFFTNDSIVYRDWPLVTAERIKPHKRAHKVSSYLKIKFKDSGGRQYVTEASYVNRDFRSMFPPDFGDEIAIRYNPDDPKDVVISFRYPYRLLLLSFWVFLFFYGWLHFIQGIRHGNR